MESDDGNCAPISPIRLHLNRKNKKGRQLCVLGAGVPFRVFAPKNGVSGKGF